MVIMNISSNMMHNLKNCGILILLINKIPFPLEENFIGHFNRLKILQEILYSPPYLFEGIFSNFIKINLAKDVK